MFGFFGRKKTDVEKLLEKHGKDYVASKFSEIIISRIGSREVAYQFVLEEMEAACDGFPVAVNFVANSGIAKEEYSGSMANSRADVDGPGGPQEALNNISLQLMHNQNAMIDLRLRIVDIIMREFEIGKYN